MHRLLLTLALAAVFALGPSPDRLLRLEPAIDTAEAKAKGRHGGFRGGHHARPRGAKTRAARPQRVNRAALHPDRARPRPGRPATRPSKPWTKPGKPGGNRPVAGRPTRPDGPNARPPGNRPPGARPPGNRPPGARPPGHRPPHAKPPGHRPPHARPPGWRPPGHKPRPPHAGRPPGWRPPHWRPPHWRPPYWRPPAYRPPYHRPPHWRWGRYHYYPQWGWYFTAAVAGATLAYVATLPQDRTCEPVRTADETLHVCDGVLYRATYYGGERVYEIVSGQDEVVDLPPETGTGGGAPAQGPRLTSPYMRGADIAAIQRALTELGYDTGGIDGVFGRGTDAAVRAFQADQGLPATGIVDLETRRALGLA